MEDLANINKLTKTIIFDDLSINISQKISTGLSEVA